MLNRAVHNMADDVRTRTTTDERPARRLVWLFAALMLPVAAIAGRLVYLQGVLAGDFYDPPQTTTVTWEWVPARCGRILSADGRVLAEDVVRYEVHAHYRWLEQPPNADWVRRRALSRLSRRERRSRERIRVQQRAVLRERREMWRRLAERTGRPPAQLAASRRRVQRRVERMLAAVERRSRDAENEEADELAGDAPAGRLEYVWRLVVSTLTTPPRRDRTEPIVLPEQSDYHRVLDDVPADVAADIEAHSELYPGLRVKMTTRRSYPQHTLAAHLIGHRSAKTRSEASQTRSSPSRWRGMGVLDPKMLPPQPTTRGKSGLELTYDSVLRGRPGLRKVVRNNRGEVLKAEIVCQPQAGHDAVVSLDADLQGRVERLLDANLMDGRELRAESRVVHSPLSTLRSEHSHPSAGGCIVAIDVHTGEILAAASAPRFDLNVLVQGDAQSWKSLTTDPRRPLFPRSFRMMLPPGSVFKIVSALAVLDSGRIDPEARFTCRGYLDRPDRYRCYIYRHFGVGHGAVDLGDAICRSCNVYFYHAARELGPKPLVEWAERLGFGSPTGVDLPGERAGNVPSPFRRRPDRRGKRRHWYPGDTLGLAIGQSRVTATPLQVARMMAAVANGGYTVTPHLLRRIDAASLRSDRSPRDLQGDGVSGMNFPRRRIADLTGPMLQRVRKALWNVVQSPRGTGYKHARVPGFEFAGKTGTAEVGGGRPDHAWFAGYAPAQDPRVAFAIVLEHAGSGGAKAGPVAKRLVQLLIETGYVRTVATAKAN